MVRGHSGRRNPFRTYRAEIRIEIVGNQAQIDRAKHQLKALAEVERKGNGMVMGIAEPLILSVEDEYTVPYGKVI